MLLTIQLKEKLIVQTKGVLQFEDVARKSIKKIKNNNRFNLMTDQF